MPRNKRWKGEYSSSNYNGTCRNRVPHGRYRFTDNRQSSSASPVETARADELEIPGFYYDKEKKRYFKIAPNHATSTCNYTRDAIAQKDAEIKRQKDIKQIFDSENKDQIVRLKGHHRHSSLTSLVMNRDTNGYSKQFLKRTILRSCVTHLKPCGSQALFERDQMDMYENLEHMLVMHIGPDHNDILALWSIRETWVQRIQRVHVHEAPRLLKQTSLSVVARPQPQAVTPLFNKATDMCWAPLKDRGECVLYTTMCHMGRQESLAILKSIDPGDTSVCQDYDLGKKATWCCAWNGVKSQFGVGSEKCALVLNVERRTLWEFNTNKSDPLSLVFSQSGNKLHTGTRKGQIITFDMRSKSTYPVSCLNHNSCVCSVQELDNDNQLLAADFTGKICLWDLRNKNVIVQYDGNVNQYSRLPVHVDETQKIVYTVGEDGYTRFWTLDQGKELYTIPPPCSVSRETIPCVQLSSRWGNRDGNIGLIMGLKNKLFYYGTLPLT